MKLSTRISGIAAAGALLFALSGPVQAITLGPGDMVTNPAIVGNVECLPGCIPVAGSESFEQLYSYESRPPAESGTFVGSYTGSVANDHQDGRIRYDDGPAIECGICWLVVKDGDFSPFYYFYNLGAAGWNGTDTIEALGFWTGDGRVKRVAIWGTLRHKEVPEPGTLGLIGLGLAGIGLGLRRRKN